MNEIKVELCAASYLDCTYADKYNMDRIELNSALELGGLTPSFSLVKEVLRSIKTPVYTMIRPRCAGFNYSDIEYQIMKNDAKLFLEEGVSGIVFGFLNQHGKVDMKRTKEFVELAHSYGAGAVFHKAIDSTKHYLNALDDLVSCRVDRVLTSGTGVYPYLDYNLLSYVTKNYKNIMEILIGGGVRVDNVDILICETETKQIHMTSKSSFYDPKEDVTSSYFGVDEQQLVDLLERIRGHETKCNQTRRRK